MKTLFANCAYAALFSLCASLQAQDKADSPSIQATDSTPIYQQPTTENLSIYRKQIKTGILVAKGVEIKFPNLPAPDMRSATATESQLTLEDTLANGTVSKSYWDLGSLTNRYTQPTPKPGGAHTNSLTPADEETPDQTFDGLPREELLTHVDQTTDADGNVTNTGVQLGSVFVDANNHVLYTPPLATIFLPIPSDVDEISAVTLLPRNSVIVLEWSKYTEDNYHVVGLNVDSKQVVFDFMPDAQTNKHRMLTWADDNTLLGEFAGRTGSSYSVIDLVQHTVSARTSAKNPDAVRIKAGQVTVYATAVDQE